VSDQFFKYRDESIQRDVRERMAVKEASVVNWLIKLSTFFEMMPDQDIIQFPYRSKGQVYDFYMDDVDASTLDERSQPLLVKVSESFFRNVWRSNMNT
jgi:hypothetical protein